MNTKSTISTPRSGPRAPTSIEIPEHTWPGFECLKKSVFFCPRLIRHCYKSNWGTYFVCQGTGTCMHEKKTFCRYFTIKTVTKFSTKTVLKFRAWFVVFFYVSKCKNILKHEAQNTKHSLKTRKKSLSGLLAWPSSSSFHSQQRKWHSQG